MVSGYPPWNELNASKLDVIKDSIINTKEGPKIPNTLNPNLIYLIRLCFTIDPYQRPNTKELLSHEFLIEVEDPLNEISILSNISEKINSKII